MSQRTNKINPARVLTPKGYKRLKTGEPLRKGDLFLHCGLLKWYPVSEEAIRENYYTNCIRPLRPIALLSEHCS